MINFITNSKNKIQSKATKPIKKDITGQVFGDFTVIRDNGRDGSGHILWLCKCNNCGKTFSTTYYELTSGRKKVECNCK